MGKHDDPVDQDGHKPGSDPGTWKREKPGTGKHGEKGPKTGEGGSSGT